MMAAAIAVVRTAAAETSLAFLADGCSLEVNESTISSIAVLMNSTASTDDMVRIRTSHS